MTVPMVAIAKNVYDKKTIMVGQQFDVKDDAEADDLEAVRMARRVPKVAPATPTPTPAPVVKPEATEVVIREITAEEASSEEKQDGTDEIGSSNGQGKYNRRDMRAKR